ncbi:S8 family serine peptidase [Neobacillus cucumis]|nr:S8 family serine peptidase [Neobacillus cucumis]
MKSVWRKLSAIGIGATLMTSTLLTTTVEVSAASKFGTSKALIQQKTKSLKEKLEENKTPLFSEDTLIIKYKQPLLLGEVKGANKDYIIVQNVEKLGYMVVKLLKKDSLQKVTQAFQKNSKVLSMERSVLYKPFSVPSDPKTKDEYYLSMLKIPEAQKLKGKNKITVAVIDTGIDGNHPELKGKVLPAVNEINPMNHGAPDQHGTHVTGIIAAAKGNGIGGYGINPNVKILPIDVFDRDGFITDYTIAQAVLYAANHGAKVINMSLGSPIPSSILGDAVKTAIQKGVTVVAASGNDGTSAPNYPASYEGVIGVGSINKSKHLSYFSSYGPSMDIVAPGEDIYAPFYDYEKKSTFQTLSGTSMASPMVAGAASLLLSKYPKLKPAQVEYILEHTTNDLGAKGYDVKYGKGLVNPVAALKYDIKNLPSFVNTTWTKKEILQNATALSVKKTKSVTGSLTKPRQQKWYQFPVQKGEYIQTVLAGAKQYDYKMTLRVYGEDQSLSMDVTKVQAGKTEGKLIQVPFSGMMAIGVSDINGNYDDSSAKQSTYHLSIKRSAVLPVDESTADAPIAVTSLPYTSAPQKLMGENGDDDYFYLKTKNENAAKVVLSGIPGIDTNIQVYSLSVVDEETGKNDENAVEDNTPLDQLPPIAAADSKGLGDGETLTFPAQPNTEYLVKVSSKPMLDFADEKGMVLVDKSSEEAQASLEPYTVKIQGKVIPPDEDNSGNTNPDGSLSDYYQSILDGAVSSPAGKTLVGYLQTLDDEDWYEIKPSKTGIYQYSLPKGLGVKPYIEIVHVMNGKDENGKDVVDFNLVGTNMNDANWVSGELSDTIFAGLKKNETYLIHLMGNPMTGGGISLDPYQLSSKLIISNTGDKYEDNDTIPKNLPSSTIHGNFASPNDVDMFYLKGKKSSIYSLLFESGKPSAAMLKKYPKELFSQIYGAAIVYKDVNKNRKIDGADAEMASVIAKGLFEGASNNYGSFKVEKGSNYIVMIIGFTASSSQVSLVPYNLSIAPVPTKDEDAKSKVKNNIPSKPLVLKKKSSHTLMATGNLNSGVGYGDEDWYVLNVKDKWNGYISVSGGPEIDGVISLYHKGKRVAFVDYYAQGQSEVMRVHLKTGKYYIKVKDVNGNATIKPYTIKVTK